MVVIRLFFERTGFSPVLHRIKQPVPYVFFTDPSDRHICPKVAACWSPAIPVIGEAFALDARLVAWVYAAFTLSNLASVPVMGWLADTIDRRSVLLGGICLVVLGAIVVAASYLKATVPRRARHGLELELQFKIAIFRVRDQPYIIMVWPAH